MEQRYIVKAVIFLAILCATVLGEECKDNDSRCSKWTKFCSNALYAGYMKKNCRLTCKLCVVVPKVVAAVKMDCMDITDTTLCTFYKSFGQCNSPDIANSCKKTCDKCSQISEWSSWGAWGRCSKTCGSGVRSAYRTCPTDGGCPGNKKRKVGVCNTNSCPTGGTYGEWGSWNTCPVSCGGGIQSQTRQCVGGNRCRGPSNKRRFCNNMKCPTFDQKHCGLSNIRKAKGRVVGGNATKEGEITWQVGIYYFATDKLPYCGGTLISPTVVLTAAHCFERGEIIGARSFVRVGDHDLLHNGIHEELIGIDKVITHKKYVKRPIYLNDVALIILKKPAKITVDASAPRDVGTACLPEMSDTFTGKCTATGWGQLLDSDVYKKEVEAGASVELRPEVLQKVDLPLVGTNQCKLKYGARIKEGMMCAGYEEGGKDTCQGDSGGPLVCKKDGKFFIYGITSWGLDCGDGYGVYTDVRKFLFWIHENMPKK